MTDKEIVIDGTNATMGRLASYAAKQALLGTKVTIVNSNEILIVGNKKDIIGKYKSKIKKGGSSMKGPQIVRIPEKIVKRTIRGMVPHKYGRGKQALDLIRCYNEVPKEYENVKKIHAGKEKKAGGITLKELVNFLN